MRLSGLVSQVICQSPALRLSVPGRSSQLVVSANVRVYTFEVEDPFYGVISCETTSL